MYSNKFWVGLVVLGLAIALAGCTDQPAEQMEEVQVVKPEFVPISEELWESRLEERLAKLKAFDYVVNDPDLPNVLLIGDSISIGYTPAAREGLAGAANVYRIPTNGGPTTKGLEYLDLWLEPGGWDVIHFNFGLHDMRHMKDGQKDVTGPSVHTIEQYIANLEEIVTRLRATGAKLIFATTTPVAPDTEGFLPEDPVAYNAAAVVLMKRHGIAVNDLHGAVAGELDKHQLERNVHFNGEGSAFLGGKVAKVIQGQLGD